VSAIETQWQWLLTWDDLSPKTREMVAAARQRLQLGRLFPYLSLERTLKFSVTTEWPYSEGFPSIACLDPDETLEGPGYVVRDRDLRPTRFVNLESALDFLVGRLPPRL
jgi:hypothetical protein